jgi:hypothetical protein
LHLNLLIAQDYEHVRDERETLTPTYDAYSHQQVSHEGHQQQYNHNQQQASLGHDVRSQYPFTPRFSYPRPDN